MSLLEQSIIIIIVHHSTVLCIWRARDSLARRINTIKSTAKKNMYRSVMSSVAYNCPRLLRQSNLVLSVLGGSRIPRTSQDPPFMSLSTSCPCCLENPLDIPGSSLGVPLTQLPMLSRGSLGHPGIPRTSGILPSCPSHITAPCCPENPLGHPGILPWCSLRHRPPCCPEDPLDIPIHTWCLLGQWDHLWYLVEKSLESDTASTLVWCHRLGLHNLIICSGGGT